MLPVVEVTCTANNMVKKADILEYFPDKLKLVVQGSQVPINMRNINGTYTGSMAGMEFICNASFEEIDIQKQGR